MLSWCVKVLCVPANSQFRALDPTLSLRLSTIFAVSSTSPSVLPPFHQSTQSIKMLISIINSGEGVEKREASYTVGGNVNLWSHYQGQYGCSLKN